MVSSSQRERARDVNTTFSESGNGRMSLTAIKPFNSKVVYLLLLSCDAVWTQPRKGFVSLQQEMKERAL